MMKSKILLVVVAAVSAFVVLGGVTASATLASLNFNVTRLAKGNLADRVDISARGIEFSTRESTDVYVVKIDLSAGATSGWHQHPGLTVVTVTAGTVTRHEGCHITTATVGQSWVEPPLSTHMVENLQTGSAQVFVTLVVPAGAATGIDAAAPNCSNGESEEGD